MSSASKIIASFSVVAVVSAIVFGLLSIGSPEHHRLARFDALRINDLQVLSRRMFQHHSSSGEILPSLESHRLRKPNGEIYNDPVTLEPYELVILDELHFQLCAVFETEGPHRLRNDFNWDEHSRSTSAMIEVSVTGSGRQCFSIEFSPEK